MSLPFWKTHALAQNEERGGRKMIYREGGMCVCMTEMASCSAGLASWKGSDAWKWESSLLLPCKLLPCSTGRGRMALPLGESPRSCQHFCSMSCPTALINGTKLALYPSSPCPLDCYAKRSGLMLLCIWVQLWSTCVCAPGCIGQGKLSPENHLQTHGT